MKDLREKSLSILEEVCWKKRKKGMKESWFTTQFITQVRTLWWRWYKIEDVWLSMKPFDVVWCLYWVPISIEIKRITTKKKDPYEQTLSWLEVHQIWSLIAFEKDWGWYSFVLWYYTQTGEAFIFPYTHNE